MAAPGPPRLPRVRLGPRLRAGLEVALRVPSLFLIDAIFNSAPLPGGSVSAALLGALLRLLDLEQPKLQLSEKTHAVLQQKEDYW
ncbi:hypothetical protein HGM15179_004791 [Zosterops borbonicus]|uniref:Uncharacterized protein n=1 Tax=Zosterops borbonicus TaxID=364589 RepID=A0A8K1GRW2_9PASS|nr:hypothetical protein HGM15179_004791 [Zosterops borbonicus]